MNLMIAIVISIQDATAIMLLLTAVCVGAVLWDLFLSDDFGAPVVATGCIGVAAGLWIGYAIAFIK